MTSILGQTGEKICVKKSCAKACHAVCFGENNKCGSKWEYAVKDIL